MNEFLAFIKIVKKVVDRLENQGCTVISVRFICKYPEVLLTNYCANKLVNATPKYMDSDEDLADAIANKELFIHEFRDGVEISAWVKEDVFPELYAKYIAMAEEMIKNADL